MKIGLVDVDSKIPNLALMKISAFHKQKGDEVKFWNFFESFDKIYLSQIFTNSRFHYKTKNMVWGGSGISLETKLPDEIEHCYPDYNLYDIEYAMGYITRGCVNKCSFCIVWRKEGKLHFHAPLEEFWDGQEKVMLLDNAITDSPLGIRELKKIQQKGIRLNLTQGFNVRKITPEKAEILAKIKLWKKKQWYIAWDFPKDRLKVLNGIEILNQAGIKNWKIMCYVLVNFNTTFDEDMNRIKELKKLGVDPFVMIYSGNPLKKKTHALARWCNRKQLFNSCSFEEFFNQNKNEIKMKTIQSFY